MIITLTARSTPSPQAAEGMIGLRSRVGGVARLQKAIVLDSIGRSSEAKELYTALKGHPHGDLAKRARRLLFGFQACSQSLPPRRLLPPAMQCRQAVQGCSGYILSDATAADWQPSCRPWTI